MTRIAIGVMTRVPRGSGKSRLRVAHDAAFVDELQTAMLGDTLSALERIPCTRRVVFVAPIEDADACAAIAPLIPEGWDVSLQIGEDLGARLHHAFAYLFEGVDRALMTGSDSPHVAIAHDDLNGLATDELLLQPCDDGGYAAIALPRLEPTLFTSMPWSTKAVAEETRRRARACGLRVSELPPTYDVDEPADVQRLRSDLARDASLAPRTAAVLRSALER